MRIAQLKKTGGATKDTTYLHADYQGSTRLQTKPDKTTYAKIDYDVWGQVRQQSGYPSAYTYTGQEWDDENSTNLFYLHARYYDPKLGRFTTPDPLPSDLNPYSYCNNNPAMMTDVSGMSGDWWRMGGGSLSPGTKAGARYGGSGGNGGNWVSDVGGQFMPGGSLAIGGEEGPCRGFDISGSDGSWNWTAKERAKEKDRNDQQQWVWNGEGKWIDGSFYSNGELANMGTGLKELASSAGGVQMTLCEYIEKIPISVGRLTFSIAKLWYMYGNGWPLSVPLASINLSRVTASDFPGGIGTFEPIWLFSPEHFANLSDALVYGHITLTLVSQHYVTATKGYDKFDFDYYGGFTNLPHDSENYLAWRTYSWPTVTGNNYLIYLTGQARIGE
jgi:RHS repeat-associated protein